MINKVHERALKVILNDNESETLLQNNNDVCNHHRNIHRYSWSKSSKLKKVLLLRSWDLSLKGEIILKMLEIFKNLRQKEKRTVYFGLQTISYRSPQLWSLLPEHIRRFNSIDRFKRSVRQWVCNTGPCRLCKVYLQSVGFL